MNTRWTTTRRVKEDLANVVVLPQGNQVPPQGNQVPPQDQAPVIPPSMTDEEIRLVFFTLDQDMTT